MKEKIKILDCSLRDGGYYTNWDFNRNLVDNYIDSLNSLPIDYIEIGYRSKPLKDYFGEYFYLPEYLLKAIKEKSNKKLVIILNEKDVRPIDLENLLKPCVGIITMVRLAIDPSNIERAIKLAVEIKKMGFEVGFNVMYMSKWKGNTAFLEALPQINGVADYFYMVDSYGGVFPEDIKSIFELVKSKLQIPIGFHGHNNLELALINTLTAIECGVDIVDATITGIGRGAGNLKMELLLTALNAKGYIDIDFNPLSKVTEVFTHLQEQYLWGTSLPYMVSGANSLPQKDVMDWVGKRYYSLNSIIRALHNISKGEDDNQKFVAFEPRQKIKKALIIGGGESVINCSEAILSYLKKNKDVVVIHASSKNANTFQSIDNLQIFCLVGNEGHRLEEKFKVEFSQNTICVLPPYPRKMGTYVPEKFQKNTFELTSNTFTNMFIDSHTAIALQTALCFDVEELFIAGYDGYRGANIDSKSIELLSENNFLFQAFSEKFKGSVYSITQSIYKLNHFSIFSM